MIEKYGNSVRNLRFFIGDVRDRERTYRATKGCDIIIHAAAMKQVPACEYNPFEAVKTNIEGTKNLIDAAIDNKVDKMVTISTDKAVNPLNLYGATKLCAEKLTIHGNYYAGGMDTKLFCVRYGNVFGSRGSVIEKFLEEKETGKLTITHPDMTRFWITINEAVEFVLKMIVKSHGAEIFVPKIPSMDIKSLASAICPKCSYKVSGIRPGEKLKETLITIDEAKNCYELSDHFVVLTEIAPMRKGSVKNAKKVPENFEYRSDTNRWKLTKEQLLTIIHKM
jgi:UDP-N-acetylglucosamine 4,6-dehydratase